MLPTPPPPEPPNQSSQSEANTPEDRPARRGGLGRFFRNLFYLSRATEAEVARQAQDRVKKHIEEIKIEEKFTNEIQETANKIKDKMRIEKNDVKKFAEEKKEEIDKLKEKLKGRINGLVYLLTLLGIIIVPLIPYIVQNFGNANKIKYLESDIEDLQDYIRDTS